MLIASTCLSAVSAQVVAASQACRAGIGAFYIAGPPIHLPDVPLNNAQYN